MGGWGDGGMGWGDGMGLCPDLLRSYQSGGMSVVEVVLPV